MRSISCRVTAHNANESAQTPPLAPQERCLAREAIHSRLMVSLETVPTHSNPFLSLRDAMRPPMTRRDFAASSEKLERAAWNTSASGAYRMRSEEHTSELQSLMRTSYAV